MTIVPFIVGETCILTVEGFWVEGGKVCILHADAEQLDKIHGRDTEDSNVSYDLRVGTQAKNHKDQHIIDIDENSPLRLKPNETVSVETYEDVRMPRQYMGTIYPKAARLLKGIVNATSKVDPGYSGALYISVFNTGEKTQTLHYGERFCSLALSRVEHNVTLYNIGHKRLIGRPPKGLARKTLTWVGENWQNLAASATVALGAVAVAEFFIRFVLGY